MSLPTERFSDRADNYAKYRPGYPPEILGALHDAGILKKNVAVADIGSGTGIFSALLLDAGYAVFAIEPNAAMRSFAEHALGGRSRFTSVDGTAEHTGLVDASVDAVVAAQAFHWFRTAEARAEFKRVLKPGGHAILIWNDRRIDSTPFLRAYEELLLKFGTDYTKVGHKQDHAGRLAAFFSGKPAWSRNFENTQSFDFEGLRGRLLSSSYVPDATQPGFQPMLDRLREIFETHAKDGRVSFDYDTRVYAGQL